MSAAPIAPTTAAGPAPWRTWLLVGALILGGAIALRLWTPSDDPNATICIFRRLTHHDCATCGMTRAMALIVRGDLRGATAYHPLSVPLAAECVGLWLIAPVAFTRGWRPTNAQRDRWLLAHAVAFLALWGVRLLM